MQYRTMPKSPDKLSILGFGCMRFPTSPEGVIDEEQSMAMLEHAYANGVNYYDTAYPYHGGASESFLKGFLAQHDRKSIYLATKLPCWLIKEPSDMMRYLDEQLDKLGTDYIDYYLLHALNRKSWTSLRKMKVMKFMEQAQAMGKIRHIGFSFHDDYKTFKKIVDAYDWTFCQIMFNYLDTHYQAGFKGYKLAESRGISVVAMEPLRGGKLVSPIPPEIEKLWRKAPNKRSMVERALRWVWNWENVSTLLSGMSTMEQLNENLRLADICPAGSLDDSEIKLYQKVRRAYIKRVPILCSECRYCMPCPYGVAIPSNFGVYNEAMMFNDQKRHSREYAMFIPENARADKCTNCGACVPKCPQKIAIPDELKKVRDYFA